MKIIKTPLLQQTLIWIFLLIIPSSYSNQPTHLDDFGSAVSILGFSNKCAASNG